MTRVFGFFEQRCDLLTFELDHAIKPLTPASASLNSDVTCSLLVLVSRYWELESTIEEVTCRHLLGGTIVNTLRTQFAFGGTESAINGVTLGECHVAIREVNVTVGVCRIVPRPLLQHTELMVQLLLTFRWWLGLPCVQLVLRFRFWLYSFRWA